MRNHKVVVKKNSYRRIKQKTIEWHKHPLFLMLVGFILTTILGAFITYFINRKEFNNKQRLLYKEKSLNTKIRIIDRVNNGLGDVVASIEQLVHNSHIYKDSIQFEESKEKYSEAILYWKYKAKSEKINIRMYFNEHAQSIFNDIDSVLYAPNENSVYITGIELLSFSYKDINEMPKEIDQLCTSLMKNRNIINKYIEQLSFEMEKEIEALKTQF
ncbi:MAG: hypothetical protein MI975_14620, partial [Cytophagales bacterium]|nr:hypothetical protein [Cytophagales bacterium]